MSSEARDQAAPVDDMSSTAVGLDVVIEVRH